ncbi:TetR/AcrR family transcriptional regulator [Tenggerimyces flavus]|uniref:TetR/AcrR family transcriptional regulator n=1 Tax=Tenggerimyces flavus TaxID=1708749 RepID=A0ABV7YLZ2_9ACTN|nr:TetR/AcrR family transcriptional regulator [Tenggerimyces flavus]MBM7786563.1 AcrR family transcriptional regulator [Tenggerimyces flavus]
MAEPTTRMKRAARRDQILQVAAEVFAAEGFAATNLDDVVAAAGVSRTILYRHFESKTDLYRGVLDRACERLAATVQGGPGRFTGDSIDGLLAAAAADPDGFRLLFRHAVNEPEFHDEMQRFRAGMTDVAHLQLADTIDDEAWARWAAHLAPVVAIEAVLAWLDTGQPEPEHAAAMIKHAVGGVTQGPRATPGRPTGEDRAG